MKKKKRSTLNSPTNIDFLDIGGKCNLKCNGCYKTKPVNITGVSRSDEISLVDKIAEDNKEASVFIYPDEITTSPYLLDSMKKVGQKITLTNGILMDEGMIERMVDAGKEYPKVTFFANPDEQRLWQGINENGYNLIAKNIELAARKGMKVVVNNVLGKSNIDSIEKLAERCAGMGVDRIKLIRYRLDEKNQEYIGDSDMNKIVENVEKAKLKDSPYMQFSLTFAGLNFFGKSLDEAKQKIKPLKGEWVNSPYLCPAIDGNYYGISLKQGTVSWCYFIPQDPEVLIGTVNTKDGSLSINIDALKKMSPDTLRKNLRGICSEDVCEYQSLCLGGCRTTAYTFAKMRGEKDPLYAGMDTCMTKVFQRVLGRK